VKESIEHEAVRGVLGGWVTGSTEIDAAWTCPRSGVAGIVRVLLTEAEWEKFKRDRETEGTEAYRARGGKRKAVTK